MTRSLSLFLSLSLDICKYIRKALALAGSWRWSDRVYMQGDARGEESERRRYHAILEQGAKNSALFEQFFVENHTYYYIYIYIIIYIYIYKTSGKK